jgi:hypothetical protein
MTEKIFLIDDDSGEYLCQYESSVIPRKEEQLEAFWEGTPSSVKIFYVVDVLHCIQGKITADVKDVKIFIREKSSPVQPELATCCKGPLIPSEEIREIVVEWVEEEHRLARQRPEDTYERWFQARAALEAIASYFDIEIEED